MWMASSRSNDALDDIHNGAQASDTDSRLLPRTLFSPACLAIYVNKCHFFSSSSKWASVLFLCLPYRLYYDYQGNQKKEPRHAVLLFFLPSPTRLVCGSHPPVESISAPWAVCGFLTSLHLLLWLNGHETLLCDLSIMRVSHCMCVGVG